jgi:hypothetical protein
MGSIVLGMPTLRMSRSWSAMSYDMVIDAESPGQRLDRWPLWSRVSLNGLIDLIMQGKPIALITWIAQERAPIPILPIQCIN